MTTPDYKRGTLLTGRGLLAVGLSVHVLAAIAWLAVLAPRPTHSPTAAYAWLLIGSGVVGLIFIAVWSLRLLRGRTTASWLLAMPALLCALLALMPIWFSDAFVGAATESIDTSPVITPMVRVLAASLTTRALGWCAPALYLSALLCSSAAVAWMACAHDESSGRFEASALAAAVLGSGAAQAVLVFGPPPTFAVLPALTATAVLFASCRRATSDQDESATGFFTAFVAAGAGVLLAATANWCRSLSQIDVMVSFGVAESFERAADARSPALYLGAPLLLAAAAIFVVDLPIIKQRVLRLLPALAALILACVIPTSIVASRAHRAAGDAQQVGNLPSAAQLEAHFEPSQLEVIPSAESEDEDPEEELEFPEAETENVE